MTMKTNLLITMCLLIFAEYSWAQNDPNVDSEPSTPDEIVLDDAEKKNEEKAPEKKPSRKAKTNEEVFIPSEEISEDKPVPFPVDI